MIICFFWWWNRFSILVFLHNFNSTNLYNHVNILNVVHYVRCFYSERILKILPWNLVVTLRSYILSVLSFMDTWRLSLLSESSLDITFSILILSFLCLQLSIPVTETWVLVVVLIVYISFVKEVSRDEKMNVTYNRTNFISIQCIFQTINTEDRSETPDFKRLWLYVLDRSEDFKSGTSSYHSSCTLYREVPNEIN